MLRLAARSAILNVVRNTECGPDQFMAGINVRKSVCGPMYLRLHVAIGLKKPHSITVKLRCDAYYNTLLLVRSFFPF